MNCPFCGGPADFEELPAGETLREKFARVLFERKPTRHPDGHIPSWDNQPPAIRASYYGDADAVLALLKPPASSGERKATA